MFSDTTKKKMTEIFTATRFNKFTLNENAVSTISKILRENLQIKNAASVYKFVNLFNLTNLKNSTFSYIERCFTIVSENKNFLELEYNLMSKILASSELLITSEIEVFKVVNRWLNHDIEERSKYTEDLYLKVRLHFLSTETLKCLLNDEKLFEKDECCVKILNKLLDCKEKKLYNFSSNYHTTRYCNQKYFKLLVLGGYNSTTSITCSDVRYIDVNKVRDVEPYPPMITERRFLNAVCLKSDIYVFSGLNDNNKWTKSVEKYSLTSKKWSQVAVMTDDRESFCACPFIDGIFVFGGVILGDITNSCLQFDTKDYSWKKVATMNEVRSNAACAVFEERIVVSGGWSNAEDYLNTVESYDVLPNKWSTMPNMNSAKRHHSLVVVKTKLFVISKSGDNCEVFDNTCKKFITIKSPQNYTGYSIRAFSIKNKIFALQDKFSKIFVFDTNKNEWSEDSNEVTKNILRFSSVKIPCL